MLLLPQNGRPCNLDVQNGKHRYGVSASEGCEPRDFRCSSFIDLSQGEHAVDFNFGTEVLRCEPGRRIILKSPPKHFHIAAGKRQSGGVLVASELGKYLRHRL